MRDKKILLLIVHVSAIQAKHRHSVAEFLTKHLLCHCLRVIYVRLKFLQRYSQLFGQYMQYMDIFEL